MNPRITCILTVFFLCGSFVNGQVDQKEADKKGKKEYVYGIPYNDQPDQEKEHIPVSKFVYKNYRSRNSVGICLNGGTPIRLGFSLEYFPVNVIQLEAAIGFYGYYGGVKLHPIGFIDKVDWSPFIGCLYFSDFYMKENCKASLTRNSEPGMFVFRGLYIPVGIEYIGDNGLTIAPEISWLIYDKVYVNQSRAEPLTRFMIGIRLGYHINFR